MGMYGGRGRVKTKGVSGKPPMEGGHGPGAGKRMPLGNTGPATSAQASAAAPGSTGSKPKRPGRAAKHGMVGQRPPVLPGR